MIHKHKCTTCDHELKHKNPVVLKRMIGMHNRFKHGIAGAHADRNKSAKLAKRVAGKTTDKTEPVAEGDRIDAILARARAVNFCVCCGTDLRKIIQEVIHG